MLLEFLFWTDSVLRVFDAIERLVPEEGLVVAVTVCDDVRFAAARTVSSLSANVVWNTDKPRHTVKNSIILFIP